MHDTAAVMMAGPEERRGRGGGGSRGKVWWRSDTIERYQYVVGHESSVWTRGMISGSKLSGIVYSRPRGRHSSGPISYIKGCITLCVIFQDSTRLLSVSSVFTAYRFGEQVQSS